MEKKEIQEAVEGAVIKIIGLAIFLYAILC